MSFQENKIGRMVPDRVNGRLAIPFQGVYQYNPEGRTAGRKIHRCIDYPADGNKIRDSLNDALEQCGLKDGMAISTHHHFRDGDLIANLLFETIADMGVQDIVWFPSASFPCHAPLVRHMETGVIHHIEGSMNGALGDFCTAGKMRGLGVLRSHGGRYQAIQDGDVHIDIAVIAAPEADTFGNANGLNGPSACGSLGYAEADAWYADKVIVVTDHLVPFPCYPWQIQGQLVDAVVVTDKVGIPERILSGTTRITTSPDKLRIAELIAQFADAAGIIKEGFSFQTGAGGISLALTEYIDRIMRRKNIHASFYLGGSNRLPVKMMEDGYIKHIIDIQAFDMEAVRSVREHANHIACGPFTTYNFHGKGNLNSMTDLVVLGATEVDVNFNANVVTHSDGRLLHGIGGWQDCLHAKCSILAVPSIRDRIPVIVDEVTTLVGPGELIDVIVTERGICINPQRTDLIESVRGSHLPIVDIQDLKKTVKSICGGEPEPLQRPQNVAAVVKWVDGTVMDCIYQVE